MRARHDRRFSNSSVLYEHAFELERANYVVGAFEHVVGSPHVCEIAIRVPARYVSCVIVIVLVAPVRERFAGSSRYPRIKPDRPLIYMPKANFALIVRARRFSGRSSIE